MPTRRSFLGGLLSLPFLSLFQIPKDAPTVFPAGFTVVEGEGIGVFNPDAARKMGFDLDVDYGPLGPPEYEVRVSPGFYPTCGIEIPPRVHLRGYWDSAEGMKTDAPTWPEATKTIITVGRDGDFEDVNAALDHVRKQR